MKKIVLFVLIAFVLFLLSGCGDAEIICSIDSNNTAEIEINLVLHQKDMTTEDAEAADQAIQDLSIYWRNSLGYDVEVYDTETRLSVVLTKSEKCDDMEEAVKTLLKMMQSEASPFKHAEGGYESTYLNEYYNIKATLDLTQLVDENYIDSLPESDKEYFTQQLSNFSGEVIFDFYGNIQEYEGDIVGDANKVAFDFSSPVEIYSLISVANSDNQFDFEILKKDAEALNKTKKLYLLLFLCAIGIALLAGGLAVFLFLRAKKKSDPGTEDKTITAEKDEKKPQKDKDKQG